MTNDDLIWHQFEYDPAITYIATLPYHYQELTPFQGYNLVKAFVVTGPDQFDGIVSPQLVDIGQETPQGSEAVSRNLTNGNDGGGNDTGGGGGGNGNKTAADGGNATANGNIVIKQVCFKKDKSHEVYAVVFYRAEGGAPIPMEIREIMDKSNRLVHVIRSRFSNHRDKDSWLDLILSSSRAGTMGADPIPDQALLDLARIERRLIQAAQPMRQDYIVKLFAIFLFILLAVSGLWAYLDLVICAKSTLRCDTTIFAFQGGEAYWANLVRAQLATIAGLGIGVLFSGIFHNRVLSLETLINFDPDGFSTLERLIYVWVVATILEILLYADVLTLGIASLTFNDFVDYPWIGLPIGIATALSTEAIVEIVGRTTTPSESAQQGTQSNR